MGTRTMEQAIADTKRQMNDCLSGLNTVLRGKRVKIISNYNGQTHGRSRPSLKGKEFEVESISYYSWCGGKICVHLKGQRVSVFLNEIEFLEESNG